MPRTRPTSPHPGPGPETCYLPTPTQLLGWEMCFKRYTLRKAWSGQTTRMREAQEWRWKMNEREAWPEVWAAPEKMNGGVKSSDNYPGTPGGPPPWATWAQMVLQRLCCQEQAVVVVQWLSCVQLFVTSWTAARQAPLSSIISQGLFRLMSSESVILSNQSHPMSRLFPSGGRRTGGFSFSPSNEYLGLISFRIVEQVENWIKQQTRLQGYQGSREARGPDAKEKHSEVSLRSWLRFSWRHLSVSGHPGRKTERLWRRAQWTAQVSRTWGEKGAVWGREWRSMPLFPQGRDAERLSSLGMPSEVPPC